MLFTPFTLRSGATSKNRVWLAPLTNQQSHADGALSDDELHFLTLRARGGFGVIETCASHVAKDGQGWDGELGIYDDHLRPGLARLAAAIRAEGSLGLVQLFHGGQRADPKLTGELPWSASQMPEPHPARAATEEDIVRVIEQFRAAAVRAHGCGFDGVELHGAHGYLLCQFLSATGNVRDDQWGGSLEGRARLLRTTLQAVRKAVPATFTVGVRVSPEDFGQAKGMDLDESLQLARWLADDGADFVHVSLWDAQANTTKRPTEHAIPLFRAALPPEVALVVAGSIWTREDAEGLLEKGATAVALGRAAIGNPDWPSQATHPAWSPRRPPFTVEELRDRGLNATFAGYMRRWKGFVV